MSAAQPILVNGHWVSSRASATFRASNPATGEELSDVFPVSQWEDLNDQLSAAVAAFKILREVPSQQIAAFLEAYATLIEQNAPSITQDAHEETGLPLSPRLRDVEIPRTVGQLRQAAAAARAQSWRNPVIDTKLNIRSVYAPIGPVLVIGPNNFAFAFSGISGGDFAAAIACGCPVIAKAHPNHPRTTRRLAELCVQALQASGLPMSTVQMFYQCSPQDGLRLVGDPRLGATAFTGSRPTGLALKGAADSAGKPFYGELSSINPVVVLPGALVERGNAIAEEFSTSCLMSAGQFCTNPGFVLLPAGPQTEDFITTAVAKFNAAAPAPLLARNVRDGLGHSVDELKKAGAALIAGGSTVQGPGYRFANTLLRIPGDIFLANPDKFQTEAFGNAALFVVAKDAAQIRQIIKALYGNLVGVIYSDTQGSDDGVYAEIEPVLRQRVGRITNDKMPTGVAVSPAMNHGGPYPATVNPQFTAVGIPASIRRFNQLLCYDNVRAARLPAILRNDNPLQAWRLVDGQWTTGTIA